MKPLVIEEWGVEAEFDLVQLFAAVPDDVALSAAARDLQLMNATHCLCGWVVREQLARAAGVDADEYPYGGYEPFLASNLFGGTKEQWQAVFYGVNRADTAPTIEEAWTHRVMQAAGVLS